MPQISADEWDNFLADFPQAHILQTRAWGTLKSDFGWQPVYVREGSAGAQVLFRRLPLGYHAAYIPKGPVGVDWRELISALDRVCQARKAVFLKIEPDAGEIELPGLQQILAGFTPTAPVQPRRTVILSLAGSETDWLSRMKQKTRYNIRLAERKDIIVQPSSDLETFSRLMQTTGSRDGFGVHTLAYYRRAYQLFYPAGKCELLSAELEGHPLAMLMVFASGTRSWYLYGASGDQERNRMPTYLLQWQAMRWAAARGCREYDLWGIPDADEEVLESNFETRSDGLWGVYRFKRGFGGQMLRSAGAWDRVYQPLIYRLYQWYAARRGSEVG